MRAVLLLTSLLAASGCQSSPLGGPGDEIRNDASHLGSRDRPAFLAELDRRSRTGDAEARAVRILHMERAQRDAPVIVAELKQLADSGSSLAAVMVSHAYWRGRGVDADIDSAAVWLYRAQALGDTTVADELAAYETFRTTS